MVKSLYSLPYRRKQSTKYGKTKYSKRRKTGALTVKRANTGNNPVINTGAVVQCSRTAPIPYSSFTSGVHYWVKEQQLTKQFVNGGILLPNNSFPFGGTTIQYDYTKVMLVEIVFKPTADFGCAPAVQNAQAGSYYNWWKAPIYFIEDWDSTTAPTDKVAILSDPKHRVVSQTNEGFTVRFEPRLQIAAASGSGGNTSVLAPLEKASKHWINSQNIGDLVLYGMQYWCDPSPTTQAYLMNYNMSLKVYFQTKKPLS